MKEMTCKVCHETRAASAFGTGWQKQQKVCNYCRDFRYYPERLGSNKVVDQSKIVTCLKCGSTFKGATNVRICGRCKSFEDYRDQSYIESITMGVMA